MLLQKFETLFQSIKNIGLTTNLKEGEQRRLVTFNLLNIFGFLTGFIILITGLFYKGYLPAIAWVLAFAPILISLVAFISNFYKFYQFALIWYFIMCPIITTFVYAGGIDLGIELFFILYAVQAVFILQHLRTVIITICFSVSCYLWIFMLHPEYKYLMHEMSFPFYFFNRLLTIFFIFVGLYLIRKENSGFKLQMESINNALLAKNISIQHHQIALDEKTLLLETQKEQLTKLDALKTRLFSIISHDLKTPIYSLRNLFKNVQQYDLSGDEIKILVPDIINDLDYTTSLMENLLLWAKSQMQGNTINPQLLDIAGMVKETQHILRLQAESKQVYVDSKIDTAIYIYADKDMIDLVLRNLISNAIKFTPNQGKVFVGASVKNERVEVFVRDTGTGISNENIEYILANNYFTTNGTSQEIGTGIGLMLCKEFLTQNGGDICVKSELGIGSIFTFTLPKA